MYFSKREVELIRAAAAAMPLGGARDSGKAQLSSLTDYAANSTLDALVMDIDTRDRNAKIRGEAAEALRALVKAISLCDEETRRLPEPRGPRQEELALRHKRAMALRYVNKLRAPGAERPARQDRGRDGRRGR
jgi:hypothetical protein